MCSWNAMNEMLWICCPTILYGHTSSRPPPPLISESTCGCNLLVEYALPRVIPPSTPYAPRTSKPIPYIDEEAIIAPLSLDPLSAILPQRLYHVLTNDPPEGWITPVETARSAAEETFDTLCDCCIVGIRRWVTDIFKPLPGHP